MVVNTNLLLAGFAKCGTTSLARYLSDHPEISTPVIKELYALVDSGPLEEYRAELEKNLPAHDSTSSRYRMDATPFYYCQKSALRFAQENDECKTIFITRNPISRLASSFRFFSEMYQEYPAATFGQFVDSLLSEEKGVRYRRRIKKPFFQYLYSLELDMGRYMSHIQRWRSVIPHKRLYVVSVEQLERDPFEVMCGVCRFLDLDASPYEGYAFKSFMRSYSVRSNVLQNLLRRMGGADHMRYDALQEFQNPLHFSQSVFVRIVGDIVLRRLQRTTRSYRLNVEQERSLNKHYCESNEDLNEWYGIDYRIGQAT